MENIEIAGRLEELADLLEIRGANPFRIRAYRNAIRTINGLTRSLGEMVDAGEDLTDLPGIGADLSSHIRELVETGGLELLEEVAREVPRELALLTRIEGVGPKKARKLWKELDVTTPDALEEAVKAGRVEALEGFGKKSAEKILGALEGFRKQQGRFMRHEAMQLLRPLLARMESAPGVKRLEVAGSYRRGLETVGDIDLLALVEGETGPAMGRFTSHPGVGRVTMAGATRGSVVLRSGLPVDLRIIPAESYGAALHYFTGSKEHNVRIRGLAREKGLKISEYGVFRMREGEGEEESGEGSEGAGGEGAGRAAGGGATGEGPPSEGARVAGATEEEVFAAVGLPWIPPVLRENRGEIQAAREGRLPDLVELDDVRGDLHMHTTWSDGRDSVAEMAGACLERGYEYLAITDHSQAVTVARGLTPERIRQQWKEIDQVRSELDGVHILRGCEVDILKDGSLDLPDEILDGLDIVLVAVHSHFHLEPAAMTDRVIRALAHPGVDILVHPTGRLINRREPFALDVDAVLEAAREHDVAVELNANPRRLDLNDVHLLRARELGLKVSLGTDSHRTGHLAHMEAGLVQARRGWLEAENIVNCLSLEEMRTWLGRKRR